MIEFQTAYIKGHTEEVMKLVDILSFDVNFPIPTTGMTLLLVSVITVSVLRREIEVEGKGWIPVWIYTAAALYLSNYVIC